MPQKALHQLISTPGGKLLRGRQLAPRLLLHLLFWCVAAAFLLYFFGHYTDNYRYTSIFVCLLMPIAIGTTYLINYFLIPTYLLQKRYLRFAWYFIFALIISIWGEMLVVMWALIVLADYQYSNMAPLTADIFFLGVALYFVVLFSTSVKLLQYWYQGQQHISELRSKQLESALKLREAELQLLKGQIHPHFLFNTLNNLYGLALEKSGLMPDAILRLSGLLDALLYRSQDQLVPLTTELKLIEDYVSLEKLRFEDRLQLEWQVQGPVDAYAIAPFLLFPFIENAFKHGFSENTGQLELQVEARVDKGQLCFKASNSVVPAAVPANASPAGGIGLQNVQRRLELQYPQKHRLHIQQRATSYQVELLLSLETLNTEAYAS
ncbi:sensor histidine kinase [Cesiribacter sp. SM1]|uniref:sensor histidine kinase n=1 Tax=Cesiribacter sp. SM1 TaxID=2861196 RepID=UPI001CD5CAFB|nr:histidine kinase [Cesiribacter sp. SM1]